MVVVPICRLHPDARLPAYATDGAAGADLQARLDRPLVIPPGGRALVPTGLAMALPKGLELQVRPRSGLALMHGITVLNTPGTVDSDHRSEIGVIVLNTSSEEFRIAPGERIAQAVIARHETASFRAVDALPETPRGTGAFGSTSQNALPPPQDPGHRPRRIDRTSAVVMGAAGTLTTTLALAMIGSLPVWVGAGAAGGIGIFLCFLFLLPAKTGRA